MTSWVHYIKTADLSQDGRQLQEVGHLRVVMTGAYGCFVIVN